MPAFVAPNVLKWHWWRFNGYGFFAGMVAGHGRGASLEAAVLPHVHPVFAFLIILAISFAASIVVCLLTRPESDEVLKSFYRTCGRGASGGRSIEKCRAEDPELPEEPRLPARHVQHRRRPGLADEPGHRARSTW